jgi:hypothetical protein
VALCADHCRQAVVIRDSIRHLVPYGVGQDVGFPATYPEIEVPDQCPKAQPW